eukprot:Platyproteum_vivax@DN13168_c0_g1_i1.p1
MLTLQCLKSTSRHLGIPFRPSYNVPPLACCGVLSQIRNKMTRVQAYDMPGRSGPTGQARKAHIGVKVLSSNFVNAGAIVVKQRKYVSRNVAVTRNRNFKLYPGENIKVVKDTSLVSTVAGRVKYTHHVGKDVLIANVIPDLRDELLEEDRWRYRTEHVASMEENRQLIFLRQKSHILWPIPLVNPVLGPGPRPSKKTLFGDDFNNPLIPNEYYKNRAGGVTARVGKPKHLLWDQGYLKPLDYWEDEGITTRHTSGILPAARPKDE